ncbi:MAG: 50S ribosomal protein L9 [Verrucomicrobiota bacterium]
MAIELILKKHIPGLGSEADVVKVRPGYARNYLIPRDYAIVADGATKKMVEELQKRRAEREAEELNNANELAAKLANVTLTFQLESAVKGGKAFGSVTAKDITERLAAMGIGLSRKKIKLKQPLKEKGEHKLDTDLGSGVHATIKVVLDISGAESKDPKSNKAASQSK